MEGAEKEGGSSFFFGGYFSLTASVGKASDGRRGRERERVCAREKEREREGERERVRPLARVGRFERKRSKEGGKENPSPLASRKKGWLGRWTNRVGVRLVVGAP